MAGKTKPGIPVKGINIKLKMINDLMDVTGSAKDSWNPAEISDDMKAIAYIHDLADTWNPAQLNEALKYLGFKTVDTWNPAELEETKNKLVRYFLPTDASGNPIELDLKGSLPYEVTALTIGLLPIQDLHGYSNPWAGGVGKNKLPMTIESIKSANASGTWNGNAYTLNGVTFTLQTDTSGNITGVELEGTASANAIFVLSVGLNTTELSSDLFNGYNNYSPYTNGITIRIVETESTDLLQSLTENAEIVDNGTNKRMVIRVANGYTVPENVLFYPMIRLATVTDSTFAPYTNICPITGRDSVTLTVNTEDTTIALPETVYGGTVNVLEGGTSSTYGYIASYDGEALPGAWISDRDAYAAGTTPTTGAEVAYVLATPDELTTSAEEVTIINGENTLSTDGDTINITYKAILNS